LGLTNPETELRNKKTPELNESQSYIWNDVYLPGINKTLELAGKDDIHVVFLGDITHGIFDDEQISSRMSDQISYGFYGAVPILEQKNVKSFGMSIGTGVHVFGEGSAEILVADRLQERYPKKQIYVDYHGLITIDAFTIDAAHHGPHPGTRNWLQGNVARYYLKSMMMDDLDAGDVPANLVLRGHFHSYVREWCSVSRMGTTYESWIVVMPSLCLLGDYGHKATRSIYRLSPGVVAFEVINGRLHQTYSFTQNLDIRTKRTL
jgi:hypothetical protein